MFLLIILPLLAAELLQSLQQYLETPSEDHAAAQVGMDLLEDILFQQDLQFPTQDGSSPTIRMDLPENILSREDLQLPIKDGASPTIGMDVPEDILSQQPIVSDISEKQQKEILDIHNSIRRKVKPTASNMMKMTWSAEASESAKRWVTKCTGTLSSQEDLIVDGSIFGENIFQSNHPASWSFVTKAWENTGSDFKYGVGATDPGKPYGSYTQIIWHKTHKVGCAAAYCPKNSYQFFYVCHYYPTGNIESQMATPYKEGLPCEDCPNNCEDKLCTSQCKYVDNDMDCKNAVAMFSCNNKWMMKYCEGSCKCGNNYITYT